MSGVEATFAGMPNVVAAELGFGLRVKALATTAPLNDLDVRKALQGGDSDWTVYQMAELALHAIDLVTISMDFDTGADPAEVLKQLADRVAAQAPERSTTEHSRVASWVLESLLNVGSVDRGFETVYGTITATGYDRRTFAFKLLDETLAGDGSIYLRASNEAVNVLVGALDVDLEADHIAADLRLEVLIQRGRLDKAQQAALNARYHTIRYGEHLRRHLEATARDVRNVDWADQMPKFLDEALSHVEGRAHAENMIRANISAIRDDADDPARKAQAAALVDVVRDCLRRNDQLCAALQSAGREFRREQSRQAFNPTTVRADLDLHRQLLLPGLGLPVGDAGPVLGTFFGTVLGIHVPHALRLADLFDDLITPPAEREILGEEVATPQLCDSADPDRFTDDAYRAVEQILAVDAGGTLRLSQALQSARARSTQPGLDDLELLVAIRAVSGAVPALGEALRSGTTHVLIAVDDGTALDDAAFAGADLLIGSAQVAAPASALSPPEEGP